MIDDIQTINVVRFLEKAIDELRTEIKEHARPNKGPLERWRITEQDKRQFLSDGLHDLEKAKKVIGLRARQKQKQKNTDV
jgi:hypothetical protein